VSEGVQINFVLLM